MNGVGALRIMVWSLAGVRILLVDDDAETLEICELVFSSEGAAVTAVARPDVAYGMLQAAPFDVRVSDIAMPDLDGYWLIERVRSLESGSREVPALALSTHASTADRDGVMSAGYQLHVAKPVDPRALVAAVRSLLR